MPDRHGFQIDPTSHRPTVRHCVDFRSDVADRLLELAEGAGVEISEVIRQAVDEALGLRRPPTAAQRRLARWMARELGADLPRSALASQEALSRWISTHKERFEARRKARVEAP